MGRLDRLATAGMALIVALFGFLPIANWIPGGYEVPAWRDVVAGWWSGASLVGGIGVIVFVFTRNTKRIPGQANLSLAMARFHSSPGAWTAGIALAALGVYLWIARDIFSSRPLLIDEVAQVVQARIFSEGSLFRASASYPEFFSSLHLLDLNGRVFSQFPAGGPAMLAAGTLLHAEWVVGPVFGAVSVLLFGALVRRIEARPGVVLASILLFALGPFVAFMSGTHMNHVTGLTWVLLGILGLSKILERPEPRVRDGLLLGLGFGMAATIRPSDALLFALPAGIWLAARTLRGRSLPALIGAGAGIVGPVAALLWINSATTGSALTFGYTAYWGPAHDVGFHATPWGQLHTPARGVELLNLYFVRLQSYLFETPVPSLVPAVVGLFLSRRLTGLDRYLLLTAVLLMGFYFAYWHDGFYLGPRFFFPLTPLLALWTARGFALVSDRWPALRVRWAMAAVVAASLVITLTVSLPARAEQYREDMRAMRWDTDSAARAAGVSGALVLVRESWGAQLIARLWAAGVKANEAEIQYRKLDACALEQALDRIEAKGLRGPRAVTELTPLLRDSALLIQSPFTPDQTNRLLPGSRYTRECLTRLREDREGFTILLPLLLAGGREDIVYARDLHARDSLLLMQYPVRSVYLLRPSHPDAAPEFLSLKRDSLLASWRKGE